LIVSDAWEPQTNGVVTTLKNLRRELKKSGYRVYLITPKQFNTIPTFYPDVRLAWPQGVPELIDKIKPDRVFIATEGPLGLAARTYCMMRQLPFVTSYTTRWPEYIQAHLGFPPIDWGYNYMRWFHEPATALMVSTPSLKTELENRGFANVVQWSRGVDTTRFQPLPKPQKQAFLKHLPRPFYLYLGRISREKNIEAFLGMDLPGSKILIGEGPDLADLREKYPGAVFTGPKSGLDLAHSVAACDVLVFPSKTDTFGLVMLEGLAAGLPVAAFDVTGPRDILARQSLASPVGFIAQSIDSNDGNDTLRRACLSAWRAVQEGLIAPEDCHHFAGQFSWQNSVKTLVNTLPVCRWTHPGMLPLEDHPTEDSLPDDVSLSA